MKRDIKKEGKGRPVHGYRLAKDNDGILLEKVPEEMWRRVAREISSVESEQLMAEWESKFYWLQENPRKKRY